jgi:proline dehydrogenase
MVAIQCPDRPALLARGVRGQARATAVTREERDWLILRPSARRDTDTRRGHGLAPGEGAVISLTWLDPLRRRRVSAYCAGPGLDEALDVCRRLGAHGLACTIGYTAAPDEPPRAVADMHLDAFERLSAQGIDGYVSVKLSALGFDPGLLAELDAAAAQSRRPLHVDALAPETADATWRLLQGAARVGEVGIALPGRWTRSAHDTELAEQLGLRVRVVKGQWADPSADGLDPAEGFLRVVDRLRGNSRGVAVATHDAGLLAESLSRLIASGTPCAAELFLGMPFRAPARVAHRLGVPIRVYVPYGHSGAPYGVTDIRSNPVAAWWLLQDLLLGKDKMWLSIRRSRPKR